MGAGSKNRIISASCEYSDLPFNQRRIVNASVNIVAPVAAANTNTETAPLSLVAVIDVSYSMMGGRLDLAKKTLLFMLEKLRNQDCFAIVTFGSHATTVLPLTQLNTPENRKLTKKTINAIAVNGCTALSDGLFAGIDCLVAAPDSHTCSVMLLTDGQANMGITNSESLVRQMERRISKLNREISVFTFGYGRDHNASFLRAISDNTNAMYYFIEKTEQIQPAFAECLGGVSSVALRSVSLRILPESTVSITRILADLQQKQQGSTKILQLGNLSSGERRNIPLELEFKKLGQVASSSQQLSFELIFTTSSGIQTESCILAMSRPKAENCSKEKSSASIEIDEQRNRVKVAETLKEVITLGEQKKLAEGRKLLNDLLLSLQNSASKNSDFTMSLIDDVRDSVDTLSDMGTFQSVGIKYLYSLSRSHYQQRASGVSSSAASAYLTDGQRDMLQALGGNAVPQRAKKRTTNSSTTTTTTPTSSNRSTTTKQQTSRTTTTTTTTKNEQPEDNEPDVSKGRLARGVRRLIADLAEIKKHPLASVTAEPLESDVFEWHCNMEGPRGSTYSAIVFHIIMQFPHTYPFQPPKLYLCSYLKHEHVFRAWICLDMLEEFEWKTKSEIDTPYTGWTTAYSVHSVLLQLQSFLFDKANLSPAEVLKAKNSAAKFSCKTCPHSGASRSRNWPRLPKNVPVENPLKAISVPLAAVKTFSHNAKDLPELDASAAPTLVAPTVVVATKSGSDSASPVPAVKPATAQVSNDVWNVVVGKGKKSKKSGKVGQPKKLNNKRNTNAPAIKTSNRFIVDISDIKVSIPNSSQSKETETEQEEESEEEIRPKSNSLAKSSIKPIQPVVNSKPEVSDDPEAPRSNAWKKNVKRRRKMKKIKEQKALEIRRAELAAKATKRAAAEAKRAAAAAAKNEAEKKQREAAAKKKQEEAAAAALVLADSQKNLSTQEPTKLAASLQESLDQLKGNARGLHRSLFIFVPDTIIMKIFSFLSVPDLINISQCCRVFHRTGTNEKLWKTLCSRYFPASAIGDDETHPKVCFGREVLATKQQLFCFHTRKSFDEDLLGIPISFKRNPRTKNIQYISTTLDLLSHEAFYEDTVRKSVWKRPFTHWLPLYITDEHAKRAWPAITKSISQLCDSNSFKPWMVVDVLPKLMNTMVVSVMSGETHASMVAIEGYCAFHHLMLKMIAKYPELTKRIDSIISRFVKEERSRTKDNTPSLGDFIPLLTVSETFRWTDVRSAYVQENFDRNALWVIKQFPGLRNVDKGYANKTIVNQGRLKKTFEANRTSMRLLMFHVYFLSNVARPDGRSLGEVTANYDLFYGRPTAQMKEELQSHCKKVLAVDNWPAFFRMIGMKVPSQQGVTFVLNQAVVNSKRKGYHH